MFLNPKILHVELTSRCVLKCPRCPRTELDLDYLNRDISVDIFSNTFTKEVLSIIDTFIFCGHTGDPIYASDFFDIIKYIKRNSDSRVQIFTNGSYKKPDWWAELGKELTPLDTVVFGIDGWDNASNNLYRVNSQFTTIEEGIRSLRANSDCNITWSMIYFSFNQDHVEKVRDKAKELGCTEFKTVKSSKFGDRYEINGIDQLMPRTELTAGSLVYDIKLEPISDRKVISLNKPQPRNVHPWARCANHIKEPFLDVRGHVLPCPWIVDGYQSNGFIDKYQQRLSIYHRPFLEILNDNELWDSLLQSFDDPMPICMMKCKNG